MTVGGLSAGGTFSGGSAPLFSAVSVPPFRERDSAFYFRVGILVPLSGLLAFLWVFASMAVTPEQQREYLRTNLDSDFLYLLEEHSVDLALQYQVGQHYKQIKTFAVLADDRAAVRTAITADFNVRPDTAADRARIACLVTAWEAARLIREEEAKLKAEAKVLGMQKPLASSDRAAMRTALETVRGYPVSESEEPAAEYLAHKLEQIENGEPTGSYLDEVISRKEAGALQLQTSLDNQGRLRITRQKPKGKLPLSTEELRAKIRLEAATWIMLSAKCKGRVYLRGLELSSFDRYLEYLLGDRCYSMQISSGMPSSTSAGQDRQTLPVPWSVLLQYEFEMRKWAVKEAHKRGEPLGDLLHEATRNTELKELHFTSQVALAKRVQHDDPPHLPNKWLRKGEKGNKGRGKGNGKNGSKTDGQIKVGESWYDLVTKTPDGRELCFAYNIKRGCQVKGCKRVHACRVKGCQGNHPAYQHGAQGSA